MKKINGFFAVTSVVCLLSISCAEVNPDSPVEIRLSTLDTEGNPGNTFKVGEDFMFDFSMTNITNNDIYYEKHDFNRENFLRVFKINESSVGDAMIDKGKPYKGLFCLEVGAIKLVPGLNSFRIPWKAPDNYYPQNGLFFCFGNNLDYLPAGFYQSEFRSIFSFSIDGEEFKTDSLHFQVTFTIE